MRLQGRCRWFLLQPGVTRDGGHRCRSVGANRDGLLHSSWLRRPRAGRNANDNRLRRLSCNSSCRKLLFFFTTPSTASPPPSFEASADTRTEIGQISSCRTSCNLRRPYAGVFVVVENARVCSPSLFNLKQVGTRQTRSATRLRSATGHALMIGLMTWRMMSLGGQAISRGA